MYGYISPAGTLGSSCSHGSAARLACGHKYISVVTVTLINNDYGMINKHLFQVSPTVNIMNGFLYNWLRQCAVMQIRCRTADCPHTPL
jgi:hypothetical protein